MTDDLRLGAATPRAESLPHIDDGGLLRLDGSWVALPPTELDIARALVDSFDHLVGRAALLRAGWPEGGASRGAFNTRISRLRHRIEPLGLIIRSVPTRGLILTWR